MQATAPEPALEEAPVDLETMRASVRLLLDPDAAPEALPPTGAQLDALTATLRGHIQLLAPEVQQAARQLTAGSIARHSVLGCVWEANSRLEAEPCRRYGGRVGYARRLARALNALVDHHEQLSRRP
ncbi:DUF6415 family natural product biosynthesis protein [Streptomyces sp. NPDC050523]|uniref:DUF6415 family natural product biosynthesis protein n=1 Tax=Streptomyces sp. NPDC050523 TaxID=3365622 RepID=UPI00378B79CA